MRENPYRVLFLTGYKQSGKDTTAEYLQMYHHFSRFSYAKMLKDICMIIMERSGFDTHPGAYPVLFENPQLKETLITRKGKPVTFRRKAPPELGEPFIKYTMTYRQFLQRVGTEAFRECIDEDTWLRPLLTYIEQDVKNSGSNGVVLSDTRFINEYLVMKDMIDTEIPGCSMELYGLIKDGPTSDVHKSELSIRDLLEHPDCIHVVNTKTIKDLHAEINRVIQP
jgi:hypothetical protein